MPTTGAIIESNLNGSLVQVILQKTGARSGSLNFRSWPPGQSADSKPLRDEVFPLFDVKVSADGSTLTCKADVFGPFDPTVICQIVPDSAGMPPALRVKVSGIVKMDEHFVVTDVDFQEISDFVQASGFPVMA